MIKVYCSKKINKENLKGEFEIVTFEEFNICGYLSVEFSAGNLKNGQIWFGNDIYCSEPENPDHLFMASDESELELVHFVVTNFPNIVMR